MRRNSDESAAHNVRKLQHPTRMAVRWVVSRRRGGRSRRAADWSDAPTYRSPSEEPDASEAHRAHAAQRSVATLRENAKGRKERRAREARARRGGAERKEASAAARARPRAPRRRRTWGDNDSHTNERKRKRRMIADMDRVGRRALPRCTSAVRRQGRPLLNITSDCVRLKRHNHLLCLFSLITAFLRLRCARPYGWDSGAG